MKIILWKAYLFHRLFLKLGALWLCGQEADVNICDVGFAMKEGSRVKDVKYKSSRIIHIVM